jgi:hypothetical protein
MKMKYLLQIKNYHRLSYIRGRKNWAIGHLYPFLKMLKHTLGRRFSTEIRRLRTVNSSTFVLPYIRKSIKLSKLSRYRVTIACRARSGKVHRWYEASNMERDYSKMLMSAKYIKFQ